MRYWRWGLRSRSFSGRSRLRALTIPGRALVRLATRFGSVLLAWSVRGLSGRLSRLLTRTIALSMVLMTAPIFRAGRAAHILVRAVALPLLSSVRPAALLAIRSSFSRTFLAVTVCRIVCTLGMRFPRDMVMHVWLV